MKKLILAMALITASPAMSDIRVDFDEGAPKDRFTVTNLSDCALAPLSVTLDISAAPSGLIFDVTASGAGVEVFQPFELVSGQETLSATPRVLDGQQAITLDLLGLAANQSIAFTIDVDDTTSDRQITVSGSEIAGAEVQVNLDGETVVASFGEDAVATVAIGNCAS